MYAVRRNRSSYTEMSLDNKSRTDKSRFVVKRDRRTASRVEEPGEGYESALERRRRRIIRAAKPVFLKYGYSQVRMRDLAQAAGVSRAALYLVFPNKHNFFCEAARELARELSEEVNRGLKSARSPVAKLKFVCELWMVRSFDLLQSPEASAIYGNSDAFAGEAVRESIVAFERDLATAIELFPRGTLPKGISISRAAHLLAGALLGIKQRCRRPEELQEEIHSLISMAFRG